MVIFLDIHEYSVSRGILTDSGMKYVNESYDVTVQIRTSAGL